ncbi:MAG: hypothetical protein JSW55_02175 [Chloroflexota bacterium]|nr:MAG: hypothetical protein JSW55_02175 [Chloroflexota bacterium]
MLKFRRPILLIILIGVLIAVLLIYRERSSGTPDQPKLSVSATVPGDQRLCQVRVKINRPENDVDLSVRVESKPGIIFTETGQNSASREVGRIFPHEERIITFDCQLDGTTLHSGAYVVKAVANHQSPQDLKGKRYATGRTRLYVGLQPDTSNIFLPTKADFDTLFTQPYVSGEYYQYKLDLQPAETKPTAGLLHVRINSSKDRFAPALDVVVSGGVRFLTPAFTGIIWELDDALVRMQAYGIDASGSRIVTVPFSMVSTADPGSYGIKVLQADRAQNPGEMAPLYIGVRSEPCSPDQKWLTPDQREDAPVLTPAAPDG